MNIKVEYQEGFGLERLAPEPLNLGHWVWLPF